MAYPRVASGALFVDDRERVLLVKPTYKERWDIPGGYVEPGESPFQACVREVREELGIEPPIGQLLVVDWAPNDNEGDKILFVFDGGQLSEAQLSSIKLPAAELTEYAFVGEEDFDTVFTDRLARRIGVAVAARRERRPLYLEHGQRVRPATTAD
jgi:ADP-ribose pyrophosphatase YjhB (NUDIX family)